MKELSGYDKDYICFLIVFSHLCIEFY